MTVSWKYIYGMTGGCHPIQSFEDEIHLKSTKFIIQQIQKKFFVLSLSDKLCLFTQHKWFYCHFVYILSIRNTHTHTFLLVNRVVNSFLESCARFNTKISFEFDLLCIKKFCLLEIIFATLCIFSFSFSHFCDHDQNVF